MEPICIREDVTIPPNDRHPVQLASQLYEVNTVTGILKPSSTLTDDDDTAFCAALVTLTNGQVSLHLNNFTDSPCTLKRGTQVATFTVLTPEQMKYVKPIDPVTTWHLLQDNPENAAYYASSLIKSTNLVSHTIRPWGPSASHAHPEKDFVRSNQPSGIRET